MSIATLKKKTQVQYNNMSVGQQHFSLNGTHRSQGYVGQDTRGRSLPKTLMKGNVLKGSGGCCGTYRITPIVQSAVTSTNNNNFIKPSVLGNNGLLMTKYRWIRRPAPYISVKPDSTAFQLQNTQQGYIERLSKNTINSANNPTCQKYPYTPDSKCSNPIFQSNKDYQLNNSENVCKTTKDLTNTAGGVPMDEGLYIKKLDENCGKFDEYKFTSNTNRGPIQGSF